MKKSLLIIASAALLLAGCAKDQFANQMEGELTNVTFTANLENGVATKAFADNDGNGTEVNRCIMEIYFQDQLYKRQVEPMTNKVATFANVPVVAGKKYTILFWADCGGGTDNKDDQYYTTANLKNVTIAKTAFIGALQTGDNDKLDAFFGKETYIFAQQNSTFDVKLKRPFAQLNVITTDVAANKAVISAALLPDSVSVKYTAFSKIDVATGAISVEENYEYVAPIYGETVPWDSVKTRGELTLSMDYILASATEQSLVNVTFKTKNGNAVVMTHGLNNLPYQRNYRTNVKGDLLTVGGTWTATIEPAWGDGTDSGEIDHIIASSYTDVVNALQSGNDSKNMKVTVTPAAVNNLSDAEKAQVIVSETIGGAPVKALKFVLYEEKKSGEVITQHASPKHVEFELPARPADVDAWKIEYETNYPTQTVVVSTPEEDNANIIIEAPKSTVTLDAAKINSVVSTTSENTLIIPQGLQLTNLEVKKGAVEYHGAGLTKVTVSATGTDKVYFKTSEGLDNNDAVYGVVRNHVAPGYAITKESETTWKIVPEVCKIGTTSYGSLKDAVAAVPTDGNLTTITMVNDFASTEKVTIAATQNIVLDLNGKKVSYTTSGTGSFIENKGKLKVKDSGANGIITAKFSAPNWSAGCYTIDNFGASPASKLVIESGTIENTSPAGLAWPINNGSWGTSADLVINGGTIHSTNYVPVREYLQYGGKKTIVINGGKLISDNSRAIAVQLNDATVADQDSYVEINGGEFSCNGSGILYVDLHAANLNTTGFTMTVNGGKFKNANADAPVLVYDNEGKDQSSAVLLSGVLKGGVYSKKPADEIVADKYIVVENEDAVYPWKVEINPENAEVSITKSEEATVYSMLADFRDKVNAGNSYEGYTVTLLKDIDMTGVNNWKAIGDDGNEYNKRDKNFSGIFDGNGKTISNLTISSPDYSGAALFGYVDGTVKNLTISNSSCSGKGKNAILAVMCGGNVTIENCHLVNCNVSTSGSSGLMISYVLSAENAVIKNCSTDEQSSITSTGGYQIGGIIGQTTSINTLQVIDCVNRASVTGVYGIGGIIGQFGNNITNATLTRCKNYGAIQLTNYTIQYAGGIAGVIPSTTSSNTNYSFVECENHGTVLAAGEWPTFNSCTGGMIGYAYQNAFVTLSMTGCKNTAAVGSDRSIYSGGMIGWHHYAAGTGIFQYTECTNTGAITATQNAQQDSHNAGRAGQLVGCSDNSHDNSTNCVLTGTASANGVTKVQGE